MSENKDTIMNNQWPTQVEDLEAARDLLEQHLEGSEGNRLHWLELKVDKKKKTVVDIKLPQWMSELRDHFQAEYGKRKGSNVTSKVLTKMLLRNETIH